MISLATSKKLETYVRNDQPFGPPDAANITEADCIAALFNWDNHAFAELLRGSHIIVGRRGAGKTALVSTYKGLHNIIDDSSTDLDEFREKYGFRRKERWNAPDIVVVLRVPDEIFWMRQQYAARHDIMPPVEVVARHWCLRLWEHLARTLACRFKEMNYPELRAIAKRNVAETALRLFMDGGSNAEDPSDTLETLISAVLNKAGQQAAIVLDSMDEYTLKPEERLILAGMFRATGQLLAAPRPYVDVKCCLPAELFDVLYRASVNIDKDFHKTQFLHWTAEELLRVAAHRLKVYLYLYHPARYEEIEAFDLGKRSELWKFWLNFVPQEIENKFGQSEHAIVYILRHTQLLPRQLITMLNSIATTGGPSNLATASSASVPFQLTKESIRAGIAQTEHKAAMTVLGMYEKQYPRIRDLFPLVLPRLTHRFSYGQLFKVWRSSAKVLMNQMEKPDFLDFWRLMLSTGAMGVVREADSNERYIVGEFEFNRQTPILISDKDELCLHPMFSGAFQSGRAKDPRVVLPRGTEFDFADA